MKTQEKTHIQKVRDRAIHNRQLIQHIIGWSDLDYCEFQMEVGYEWVDANIPGDRWGRDILVKSEIFWKWWINQWNRRDAGFLEYYGREHTLSPTVIRTMREIYKSEHRLEKLNCYPNRIILEDTFKIMVGDILREARR